MNYLKSCKLLDYCNLRVIPDYQGQCLLYNYTTAPPYYSWLNILHSVSLLARVSSHTVQYSDTAGSYLPNAFIIMPPECTQRLSNITSVAQSIEFILE